MSSQPIGPIIWIFLPFSCLITYQNSIESALKHKKFSKSNKRKPSLLYVLVLIDLALYIAYGMEDGQIIVLKTQNGQSLLSVTDSISQPINSFSFVQFAHYPIDKIFPFKQFPITQKLILQILPHKNCKQSSIVKLNYFNELNNDDTFNLLVASNQKHTSLHLNGFVTIAQLGYDLIAAKHFGAQDCKVQFSHFNSHSYKLQCVVTQQSSSSYIINLVQFDAQVLRSLQPNIIKFNFLFAYISEILSFVQMAYPAAELCLRDILRQYNSKMNLIDDQNQENVNPCAQLFKYLNYGLPTNALMNFLKKQVYDTRVLQTLDQVLNVAFNNLHDLLLQSIQNSLERAYLLVNQLKNLAQLENYRFLGVKSSDLQRIEQQIEKLYTMGQILLVESTQAKFDIRNLLVWLNKASMKTGNDPSAETQNLKSHLSRYTVDFTRLHGFLESQNKFRLQNLISFFSKTNETNHMVIPECEFRLLNRINNQNSSASVQLIRKTKEIQQLLQLTDISIWQEEKMPIELTYKSFRLEHGTLQQEWKKLRSKPIIEVSKMIEQNYEVRRIGEVQGNELRGFEIKRLIRKKQQRSTTQLILYWLQGQPNSSNRIIQYSIDSKTSRYITIPRQMIPLSISIGADKLLLVQKVSSMNEQKTIIQIMNQEWQGEQLEQGRLVERLSGEVMINGGLRGLNLLVQNKTRLVVFD